MISKFVLASYRHRSQRLGFTDMDNAWFSELVLANNIVVVVVVVVVVISESVIVVAVVVVVVALVIVGRL